MLLPWLRSRRRRRLLAGPVPAVWLDVIARNVPLAARLSDAERAKLLDDTRVFVATKNWEGCGGLTVSDEMKVTVAAHACLLLVGIRHDDYERVRSILIYPSTVVPPDGVTREDGVVETGVGVLGQAWQDGPVVLAWDEVLDGCRDDRDGRNVVLHEFAHQLDYLDGEADGEPPLPTRERYAEWRSVMAREFDKLAAAADTGTPTLLDVYGATDRAELFAVATECFFERPIELRDAHPDLYRVLSNYYNQSPADRRPLSPVPPVRLSRADPPAARARAIEDWPGWVTFWAIEPGLPRSEPMGTVGTFVNLTIGGLFVAGVSAAFPEWRAKWYWAGGLIGAAFAAAVAAAVYRAVRWVDRRDGWAGQGVAPPAGPGING